MYYFVILIYINEFYLSVRKLMIIKIEERNCVEFKFICQNKKEKQAREN